MNNENFTLEIDSALYETNTTPKYLRRKSYQKKDPKKITAFIPGAIKKIFIYDGKILKAGDQLLILEAMKMENILKSPITGRVKRIHTKIGDKVIKDQLLIELE
jgi:biotin carboxyl carrier protein